MSAGYFFEGYFGGKIIVLVSDQIIYNMKCEKPWILKFENFEILKNFPQFELKKLMKAYNKIKQYSTHHILDIWTANFSAGQCRMFNIWLF